MQDQSERGVSNHLRPHLSSARQLICLASGRPADADNVIEGALEDLVRLDDLRDRQSLVLCFYGLVVTRLNDPKFKSEPITLIGALPLTSEGAAVGVLTLDFSSRIAYILQHVLGFSAEEAAFIRSVQSDAQDACAQQAVLRLQKILN